MRRRTRDSSAAAFPWAHHLAGSPAQTPIAPNARFRCASVAPGDRAAIQRLVLQDGAQLIAAHRDVRGRFPGHIERSAAAPFRLVPTSSVKYLTLVKRYLNYSVGRGRDLSSTC